MPYAPQPTQPGAPGAAAPTSAAPSTATPSPSGSIGAINTDLASSNPTTQAYGVIAAGQAQGIAGSGLSMAQLMGEAGLVGVSNAQETQYNTESLENSLSGASLDQAGNAIQQVGAAAQGAQTAAQQGFTTGEYDVSKGQYPEQLQEAALQNQNAQKTLADQGAISGTLNTQGQKAAETTQQAQYGWQQEDIGRSAQLAALGQQSGLSATAYSEGDIARTEQNLQLAAAANGLSVEQMKDQFVQGQNQQNTGSSATLDQLYTQYLGQQSSAVSDVAQTGATAGLLTPGSILSTGQAGGLNLNTLFAGATP
jgi:hypothetical protein